MVQDTARRIAEFLEDRLDRGLRTVVVVREDDWTIHYLREDLKDVYTRDTYEEVIETFRVARPTLETDTEDHPVGRRQCLVHSHERAFVVQLPYGETDSILLSVTREVGPDLDEFLTTCRGMVTDDGA